MKTEIDTNTDVLETCVFTKISEEKVYHSRGMEIMPLINMIKESYNLNFQNPYHYDIAKKILMNSVKWN